VGDPGCGGRGAAATELLGTHPSTKEVPEKKFVDKAGGLQPAHRNKVAI